MKRVALLLIGALVCTSSGCGLFSHFTNTSSEKSDKPPTPMAGAPTKHVTRVAGQFWFFSDIKLQEDHRFFKEVASHREHVYRELRLPPSSKDVLVYLFDTKENYEQFLAKHHPKLPERRAFFVAQAMRKGGNEDLMVYTYLNDTIQKDLRHELTHAMLHSVCQGVPIWLDEGLAEYFELPVNQNGVNPTSGKLRAAGTRFELERLEKLEEVHDMSPAEYRESWAWVHLMLRRRRRPSGHVEAICKTCAPIRRRPLRPRWRTRLRRRMSHAKSPHGLERRCRASDGETLITSLAVCFSGYGKTRDAMRETASDSRHC